MCQAICCGAIILLLLPRLLLLLLAAVDVNGWRSLQTVSGNASSNANANN
jgi:hypothetical protein